MINIEKEICPICNHSLIALESDDDDNRVFICATGSSCRDAHYIFELFKYKDHCGWSKTYNLGKYSITFHDTESMGIFL